MFRRKLVLILKTGRTEPPLLDWLSKGPMPLKISKYFNQRQILKVQKHWLKTMASLTPNLN